MVKLGAERMIDLKIRFRLRGIWLRKKLTYLRSRTSHVKIYIRFCHMFTEYINKNSLVRTYNYLDMKYDINLSPDIIL